jgi:type IV pilus assembly protein PilO
MTLVQQLNQLNPKDVGGWPIAFKIGLLALIFIALVGAAAWFVWRPQWEDLAARRQDETKLRETFTQKKALAVNLEAYERQLKEIQQAFGTLLKQLPKKSEMPALITDVNQAGLGRGLQFELFRPAIGETLSEFYAELPVDIKVTGDYHSLGAFASDVAKLPRIVLLNNLTIALNKDAFLTMDAVAKTYRYLDDDEVAAQQKTAKEKAAKEKGGGKK